MDQRLVSLVALSAGIMLNLGQFSTGALLCVVVSAACAANSLFGRRVGRPLSRYLRTGLVGVLALLTLLYPDNPSHPVFPITVAAVLVAIVLFTLTRRHGVRVTAVAVAAGAWLAGLVAHLTWGAVGNDVFDLQQAAARALLGGHDPYAPTVPSMQVIAPGVAAPVQLHFPYGPILPVLEAPFRLLGDVRVLHVIAAILTAVVVVVLARRAGTLDLSAIVLMAFPLTIGMIIFSWVDVVTMAAFATWLVAHRSHPRIAVVALAMALAARPTTLVALVPILFWSVRARRQVVIAGVLAALTVLPFAIVAGLPNLYHDMVGVFLTVLPRFDSLTANSFLHSVGLPMLPAALSVLIVASTIVVVLRRRPASYGQLLTGSALIVTVSFLVAKWAYFNYYYIAAVLLVAAVAGDSLEFDAAEMIRPPALVLGAIELLGRRVRRLGDLRPRPDGALHRRLSGENVRQAAPPGSGHPAER